MHRFLLAFSLILISSVTSVKITHAASVSIPLVNSVVWGDYIISKRIDPSGDDVTKGSINDIFKGIKVVIDNENVTVSGVCKYEYSKESMSPLKYWYSKKTVDLYRSFLSGYNVKLNDNVNLITPVNPSVNCIYPFSYFIEVDNSLVFVLKNRAVIYFNDNRDGKGGVSPSECVHKKQTPEQVYANGDIDECYYKGLNILDSYQKYRNRLVDSEKRHLMENIKLNENASMKCDDGCIVVKYKWKGPDNLVISQQFDGGETMIYFSKKEQGSRVVTKSFPD